MNYERCKRYRICNGNGRSHRSFQPSAGKTECKIRFKDEMFADFIPPLKLFEEMYSIVENEQIFESQYQKLYDIYKLLHFEVCLCIENAQMLDKNILIFIEILFERKYQTEAYKRVRVDDIDSNIAIAIKDDASIDYINLLNKEKINQDGNVKYTYSDGVILQEMYNFQTKKNEFTVITPKKVLGTFSDISLVDNEYVNGYMKINTESNKYNFINKKGNILSNKEYEEASDFNENGFAIVSNDKSYGVINTNGKEIIDLKYDNIIFLDDTLFKNVEKRTNEQLFIFEENNKYGIINSNGKVVVKPIYSEFKTVTTKYPIIKAKYNDEYILVNLESYKDLSIDSNNDVQIYEDYIVSNDEYYNYDGQLIYSVGDK